MLRYVTIYATGLPFRPHYNPQHTVKQSRSFPPQHLTPSILFCRMRFQTAIIMSSLGLKLRHMCSIIHPDHSRQATLYAAYAV